MGLPGRISALACFLSLCVYNASAQVVFCPPGAQWTGYFIPADGYGWNYNAVIRYAADSITDVDTIKILTHNDYFSGCENDQQKTRTLIRQRNDTILLNNYYTYYTWQILINYAAVPGQSWEMKHRRGDDTVSISFDVTDTGHVRENGYWLRTLKLNDIYVTERYGWGFLFQFPVSGNCERFGGSLCYSDDNYGFKRFSKLPCDYHNPAGISEKQRNAVLFTVDDENRSLRLTGDTLDILHITISDLNGRVIRTLPVNNGNVRIGLEDACNALLILQIHKRSGQIISRKFAVVGGE